MKKLFSIVIVVFIIATMGSLTVGAASSSRHRSHVRKTVDVKPASDESSSSYRDKYTEERRKEYEAIIDEEVEKGNLTKEEAELYKADFFTMSQYCGGLGRGHGSGMMGSGRGYGGCHRYR